MMSLLLLFLKSGGASIGSGVHLGSLKFSASSFES